MDKRNLAFGPQNFVLLAAGMLVVILGLVLMSGGSSSEQVFDASIFSFRHTTVAPLVTLAGFVSIIGAIVYKPKGTADTPAATDEKEDAA